MTSNERYIGRLSPSATTALRVHQTSIKRKRHLTYHESSQAFLLPLLLLSVATLQDSDLRIKERPSAPLRRPSSCDYDVI